MKNESEKNKGKKLSDEQTKTVTGGIGLTDAKPGRPRVPMPGIPTDTLTLPWTNSQESKK